MRNGSQSLPQEAYVSAPPLEPVERRLGPGTLRRLQLMQVALDGATEIAQAAVDKHQARKAEYQRAFEAACEDADILIPSGENDVQINWATGEVRFNPR